MCASVCVNVGNMVCKQEHNHMECWTFQDGMNTLEWNMPYGTHTAGELMHCPVLWQIRLLLRVTLYTDKYITLLTELTQHGER